MTRLAISNIAWEASDEPEIAELLRALGVDAVEIAPTKRWTAPATAADATVADYREFWGQFGIEVVAMQSLLFGRDDLVLFGSAERREETAEYLCAMTRLAGRLGAGALVFGSPKNRRVGASAPDAVRRDAVAFFRAVGACAAVTGTSFCIEPNPADYGCDYLTTTAEVVELLRAADSPGLGLHLDAAAVTLSGERFDDAVRIARPWLRHAHVSEPFLAPIGSGRVDHRAFASALADYRYGGALSIEMRPDATRPATEAVRDALSFTRDAYAAVIG